VTWCGTANPDPSLKAVVTYGRGELVSELPFLVLAIVSASCQVDTSLTSGSKSGDQLRLHSIINIEP
jgi:hypothetical protein